MSTQCQVYSKEIELKNKFYYFNILILVFLITNNSFAQIEDDLLFDEEELQEEIICVPESLATNYDHLRNTETSLMDIRQWYSFGSEYFKKIRFSGNKAYAGAGVLLRDLIQKTCEKNLGGLEGLAGIPGTVGGAIFMNSSYVAGISEYVESVKVINKENGSMKTIKSKDIQFGYRKSGLEDYIITEAVFREKI